MPGKYVNIKMTVKIPQQIKEVKIVVSAPAMKEYR
jgi:hypothetical protein